MSLEEFIDLSFAESQLHRMFDANQTSLWDAIEQFGMVLDADCPGRDLVGYWNPAELGKDQDGTWYFPTDDSVAIVLISLDSPPMVDVAWDARSITQ